MDIGQTRQRLDCGGFSTAFVCIVLTELWLPETPINRVSSFGLVSLGVHW